MTIQFVVELRKLENDNGNARKVLEEFCGDSCELQPISPSHPHPAVSQCLSMLCTCVKNSTPHFWIFCLVQMDCFNYFA